VNQSLRKRILGLRASVRAAQAVSKGGGQASNVRVPAKPAMRVVVRRFQGVYECGCKVPDPSPEAPELCEIHERPFKYVNEDVGTFDAREED
jgi:hypothetical protein